jgi:hypothetical protein
MSLARSAGSHSRSPSLHFSHAPFPPAIELTPLQEEIIRILEIEPEYLNMPPSKKGVSNLPDIFKHYEICITMMQRLHNSNPMVWTIKTRPLDSDVQSFWIKPTQFRTWVSHFDPVISFYLDMVKWLRNDPDKKSDLEVWSKKFSPSMPNLKRWLEAQKNPNASLSPKKKKKTPTS